MALSKFIVLDAAEETDHCRWRDLWEHWPEAEVFAHPAYVRLFCRNGDRAICAVQQFEAGGVLVPLVARPLEAEPWGIGTGPSFDLTSPYGYGGPFRWGDVDADAFWTAFGEWAARSGAVSCFLRLSLFPDQTLLPAVGVEEVAPNIVRSLDLTPEELWKDYEHKVRKNVNRARRHGLTVEVDQSGARIGEFVRIYLATMDRRSASYGYYFTEGFFRAIVQNLPGQFCFFHTLHERRVVATELVLVSRHHVYSFLGGTEEAYFEMRPNDLLKHEIGLWARAQGHEAFVLGGGYSGVDGIFRYKQSFAPRGERPFRVAKRVFDEAAYQQAVERRRRHEASAGRSWDPPISYFPSYRG